MNKFKKLLQDVNAYSNESNLLIYQMGKVGSTSLEETIKDSLHVHSLYSNWPCFVFYQQRRRNFPERLSQHFYDWSRRVALKRRKKIKIISLVRDPYARNISMFFQNLQHWMYYFSKLDKKDLRLECDLPLLFEVFEKAFDHDYPLTWFDKEINRFTGIDIYKYPFDKEKGYSRIQNEKYDILLIKLESLKFTWNVVEDFVGSKLIFQNVNLSSDKWYAPVYENFIRDYAPSETYLDKIYNSKLAKHFYTKDEILKFRNKVLKRNN
jgi:hypothetical protein